MERTEGLCSPVSRVGRERFSVGGGGGGVRREMTTSRERSRKEDEGGVRARRVWSAARARRRMGALWGRGEVSEGDDSLCRVSYEVQDCRSDNTLSEMAGISSVEARRGDAAARRPMAHRASAFDE